MAKPLTQWIPPSGSGSVTADDTASDMLLETGDFLLLENGDNLLLESVTVTPETPAEWTDT